MDTITKENIANFAISGKFDIPAAVRPEQGSKEVKKVTLRVVLENTPLNEVIQSMLKDKRINWQSGARSKWSSIQNGGIVEYAFKGGRTPTQDPEEAMTNRLKAMTPEAQEKWFREKMAEVKKKSQN